MATFLPIHYSPSVELRETDNSEVITTPIGTTVLIAGFTEQGPSEEPTFVSNMEQYEETFGLPTCPATRYSHNAVKQILTTSPGNVLFTRMPFGSGGGFSYSDNYSALVYPIIGVSAVETSACDYFRDIDEDTCRTEFPELYNVHYKKSSLCYGSANLDCPLSSKNEVGNTLYVHNHPVSYDSILTGFKFVVDSDSTQEELVVVQLRPTTSGDNISYEVVNYIELSNVYATMDEDQSNLSNDGKRLIVDLASSPYATSFTVTEGFLTGQTLSGIPVSAGDIFGTYSDGGVLKYFDADPAVANTYNTGLTSLGDFQIGETFSVEISALAATTQDSLISFCATPVVVGLSCQTVEELGLKVPEKDRYTFYPLEGEAQLNDANFYVIGEPVARSLSEAEYELLENGQFNWKCGTFANVDPELDVVENDVRAGIVVVNKIKAAQLEDFSGYYLAVNDNLNVNPATDFNDLTAVAGYYDTLCPGVTGEWVDVPENRWNFKVSETFQGTRNSISEIVEKTSGPNFANKEYNDSLSVSLFKLRPSRLTETINKLDAVLVEKYIGSLNSGRKVFDEYGGAPRSVFIEDAVNASRKVKMFVNPYLSKNNCWNSADGVPQKTVRMYREKTATVFDNFDTQQALKNYGDKLYGVGNYNSHCKDVALELCKTKDIGNLPLKLERALMGVENPLDFPVDIVVDAGLSTIWSTRQAVVADDCITDPSVCYYFDDTYFVDTDSLASFNGTDMFSNIAEAWATVANVLINFGQHTRKNAGDAGSLVKLDPLRQIFINGKDYKVSGRQKKLVLDPVTGQPSNRYSTFSRNIYTPLKNLLSKINSNFASTEANWIKTYDSSTDSFGWYGPSAFVAANLCRNDSTNFAWTPAFGIENGKLSNVVDLAINPSQKDRDLISIAGANSIVKFPEGYIVYDSNTLQKETSALSEEYIRRGMLWVGKALIASSRRFVGKPNSINTRTSLKNDHSSILEFVKDNGGLADFLVKCDRDNNPPDLVDRGVLNVADYVQWIRAVKHVLINLQIERSGVTLNNIE